MKPSSIIPSVLICFLFLMMPLAPGVNGATLYVPDNYVTIQGAITAAVNGDTVIVRAGTYDENIDFMGKAITVRSLQGSVQTVIDGGARGSVAIFAQDETAQAVLKGFTLTNGTGTFDNDLLVTLGGGVFCEDGSPRILNCRITNCSADLGGAASVESGSPTFSGCVISGNTADNGGALFIATASPRIEDSTIADNTARDFGGGIYCWQSSPIISGNTITGNQTEGGAGRGGGLYVYLYSSPTISNNVISDNMVTDEGGGICCRQYSSPNIIGNTISGNIATVGAGIRCVGFSSPAITKNAISGNLSSGDGGGIDCQSDSNPRISDNTFTDNQSGGAGGGLHASDAGPIIHGNTFTGNQAVSSGGGGVACKFSDVDIRDNLFLANDAPAGGGVYAHGSSTVTVANCVLVGNTASDGGGLYFRTNADVLLTSLTVVGNSATDIGGGAMIQYNVAATVHSCIFWENTALLGSAFGVGEPDNPSSLAITYSDVEGGIASVHMQAGCTLDWGLGMIDEDPLFVAGPVNAYCLSQTAAGQSWDSPCVDAADPDSGLSFGSTRTDVVQDRAVPDMGYHSPTGSLVTGPGPAYDNAPLVRVFSLESYSAPQYEFSAYRVPHYGVNISCGDVNGDQADEILTGAGPGRIYGPHVRAFQSDGTQLPGLSFLAYGTNRWGVNVAAGNLDGDARDEIITGAGPGAVFGPHVRAFDYNGSSSVTPMPGVSFMAYGTNRWGVNVTAGDVDGDGFDEIITGAGPGAVFGPHVRGWNVDNGTAAAIPLISYFAYGTPRFGVRVSCGDVDGDGIDEIVTAPGPSSSFGAHIRGWNYDGSAVTAIGGINFFAWQTVQATYGARIFAGADLDGDGRADIVTGVGPDPSAAPEIRVYQYNGTSITEWLTLDPYDREWAQGVDVAAGRF